MARQNILQVDSKGRITLPVEVRKRAQGLFTYEVDPQGTIRLKPIIGVVTPEQAYFWTERWQTGEKEASTDIQKGRVTRVPQKQLKKFLADL